MVYSFHGKSNFTAIWGSSFIQSFKFSGAFQPISKYRVQCTPANAPFALPNVHLYGQTKGQTYFAGKYYFIRLYLIYKYHPVDWAFFRCKFFDVYNNHHLSTSHNSCPNGIEYEQKYQFPPIPFKNTYFLILDTYDIKNL